MDGIIDQVRRMPLAEKRRLAEALRQAIAEELASGGGEPDRCPRCGCPAFVRKGRDAAGRQRWLCRGCGRTFGAGMLPPMYFPPFTPMIHNRSRQPAPAGYANVFPPLSAPPPNLSRNARASRARALSEPG